MRFSERYGYKPVREIIQKESMDEQLRNALWSILHTYIWSNITHSGSHRYTKYSNVYILIHKYWFNIFKRPTDDIPSSTADSIKMIRDYFFNCEWFDIYSFIEETYDHYPSSLNRRKEALSNQLIIL